MIKKSELLCCALSLISVTGQAMEVAKPMNRLAEADAIAIWDPEEQAALMQKKCAAYENSAAQSSSDGIHGQLRMAIIWHNGLFGHDRNTYKAIPYWTALANQVEIPSLRVLGLEMLGVYHQEGWQSFGGSKVKPDLSKAKQYFVRAIAACRKDDPECQKDQQMMPRLHTQLQAVIKSTN